MLRPKLTRTEALILPVISTVQHNLYGYFDFSDYKNQSLILNIIAILFILLFFGYLSFLYYNRRKKSENKNTK